MRRQKGAPVSMSGAPAELYDQAAEVWHAPSPVYAEYMRSRGWSLPASERVGVPAHPGNRRRKAVDGWARSTGHFVTGGQTDWNALRSVFAL